MPALIWQLSSLYPLAQEYLFLSHQFVHQKLRGFVPPCPVEVQLEVEGDMQAEVRRYEGVDLLRVLNLVLRVPWQAV